MTNLKQQGKSYIEEKINYKIESADFLLLVIIDKYKTAELNQLNASLQKFNLKMFSIKNKIARKALDKKGLSFICNGLEGNAHLIINETPLDNFINIYKELKKEELLRIVTLFANNTIFDQTRLSALLQLEDQEALNLKLISKFKTNTVGFLKALKFSILVLKCKEFFKLKG